MLRDTQPDYSVRYEALLRIFCLWALPTEEALVHLTGDRAEFARHLAQLDQTIADMDWGANPVRRSSRIAIEFGRRFYAAQIDWIDWAAEQVAAGTLQPDGPLPAAAAGHSRGQ